VVTEPYPDTVGMVDNRSGSSAPTTLVHHRGKVLVQTMLTPAGGGDYFNYLTPWLLS